MTKTYDTAYFIERASRVHDNKFDYSKAVYNGSRGKLIVICKTHGEFEIGAHHHLDGRDCISCFHQSRRKTTKQFIVDARVVHGDRYEYNSSKYVNKRTNLVITCSEHGNFKMTPSSHLRGYGCQECASTIKTTEQFISECKKVHGETTYGYEHLEYVNAKTKVIINCCIHGDFKMRASHHLGGSGCPKCSVLKSGFKRSSFSDACCGNGGLGVLYVIKCVGDNECFYKIGITSRSVSSRYSGKSNMPYQFTEVFSLEHNADFIFDMEKRLHNILREKRHKPKLSFGGMTECFSTIKPIEKLLKKLSTTEQLQLIA